MQTPVNAFAIDAFSVLGINLFTKSAGYPNVELGSYLTKFGRQQGYAAITG
jgi:hypothetical protein